MSKLEKVKQEVVKYDYVRFSLCDLNGTSRGHVIKGRHAAKYLEHGLALFEGTLAVGPRTEHVDLNHGNNHFFGNMNIFPDPDTLRPIPWAPGCMKVAEILCESRWMKDNTPQMACPRFAARKQFQRLADLGCDFYSGHEIEFTLLDETLQPVNDVPDGYGLRLMNKHSKILFHFDKNFEDSNISVERYYPELGRGMFEAVTTPKYGIDSLDMAFNLQQGLLEMADLEGLTATFMSQPFYNESGLCAHLNFSLWTKSGENVFYDADAADKLSEIAKQWIAGILKHSKALHAFTSPTVNCYRNMSLFLFASSINWGIENRAACIRVKNDGPLRTYIENRLPSSKSNAYLVAASTIAAGLDGVIKKMECPPPGITEHDEPLPRSLAEALEELEQDEVLCDALGEELVTWFVKSKRDADIPMFEGVETDEERFAIEKKAYL